MLIDYSKRQSEDSKIESVQDFLIKLDIKPLMHLLEISTFSLNSVIVRLTKIMKQKSGTFLVNKVLEKSKFSKKFIYINWSSNQMFFTGIFFWKDSINFRHLKMTLKLRILRSLTRLLIILVSLRGSLFS